MSTSVVLKLNAQKLREYSPSADELQQINRKPIYIIVENVLDTYNIGAIFRLADAVAASAVYLVGDTATPDDPLVGHKIHKSSVGTWRWTPWKYAQTVKEAIEQIQNSKFEVPNKSQTPNSKIRKLHLVAVEQHKESVPYTDFTFEFPVAFIVGHETTGVSKEALSWADAIVEIPLFGVNKSLNVMVSLAIVLWKGIEKL